MVQKLTNDEMAYIKIKKAILSGYFKPGERLLELNIAEKLSISRTPVREAIKRLELEGFLVREPYKGVMVKKFTIKEARNVYEVRSTLEGLACYLVAQKDNEQLCRKLDKNINDALKALKKLEYDKLAELNNIFHNLIATASENDILIDMIKRLRYYISILRVSVWTIPGRPKQTLNEHSDILIAIRNKNAELARKQAINHIENSWKVMRRVLNEEVIFG